MNPIALRWAKFAALLCLTLLLPAAIYIADKRHTTIELKSGSNFAPNKSDVIRDGKRYASLGGMNVAIPVQFANYVEYDADPGWGEKAKDNVVRTATSGLRSFGFYVRFPDMLGLTNDELRKDRQTYSSGKPWILVGINTGEYYPGDGFLDRRTRSSLDKPNALLKYKNYEKHPHGEHSLMLYVPIGTDPKTQMPYRDYEHAEDIYIHRTQTEEVDTYISCSNRKVASPPCRHNFSLGPGRKAQVSLSYSRFQLSHWKEIQEAVRQLVLSFEVKENKR